MLMGAAANSGNSASLVGQGDLTLPCLDLSLSLDEIYFGVLDA